MKLYVLDLGKIVMMGDNPVTKDEGENPAIPIHAFLLDTPAGYVLFDTGCHPQAMEGAWPKELCGNPYVSGEHGSVPERLAELRIRPEEISAVVLSHLHLDHAGGAHFFPQAKIYVQQEELEHVMADQKNGTLSVFHQKCDLDNWEQAHLQWVPVPAGVREVPLCPGVTIVNLGPGHSYGMLGMLVELESGNYLLAADAIYSRAHYEPVPQLSGVVYDEKGYFDTMEFLRRYAAEHHAELLFGHDMKQFQSLKKSTEGYYQ